MFFGSILHTGMCDLASVDEMILGSSIVCVCCCVSQRPAYQETVVKKYLEDKAALPAAGDFNETGRGFPDVAALGHNYFMCVCLFWTCPCVWN